MDTYIEALEVGQLTIKKSTVFITKNILIYGGNGLDVEPWLHIEFVALYPRTAMSVGVWVLSLIVYLMVNENVP